jgi:hypothetical protein
MKICIVIQSEAFRSSAGMRIRYDRFRNSLRSTEVTIDALTSADLAAAKTLDHDVYVFCKTFDAPALLLARRLRAAGKAVGQDLFDDYFSQRADTRLQRYRDWLRDMAPVADFAICSTPRMVEVARSYMPDTRIIAVEDPIEAFDSAAVALLAEQKAERARSTRSLDVVWFGIGDNPFFPVGLTDLAVCDAQLALMERFGWTVRLRIVTNRRAFEGAGAEMLRRLSIGFQLVEWTEEAEREALADATVAIIPVNGQLFSRAKSLNRAVTALSAGCQVLSCGFPLYERLADFLYRSAEELAGDLETGKMRVGRATIDRLTDRLSLLADPARAAAEFAEEARRALERVSARPHPPRPVCLLHGRATNFAMHKAVGAIGGYSVKTIFSNTGWNFPVRFDREGSEIRMRVTPQIAQKHQLPLRSDTEPKSLGAFDFVDLDVGSWGVRPLRIGLAPQTNPILDLAIYDDVMRFAGECCGRAFPGADILISDSSIFSRRPLLPVRPARTMRSAPSLRPEFATSNPMDKGSPPRWRPLGNIGKLVRLTKGQALQHAGKLLAGSPLFDAEWYLRSYPDVAENGLNPIRHYLEFGWREGRNPSPLFSTKEYLKANKDVAEQGINPLVHYLQHGEVEGRVAPPARKSTPAP